MQRLSAQARRDQDVAWSMALAKTNGDLQGIGKYLPQPAATALHKVSDVVNIVCGNPKHGTVLLKERAFQGPCPCALWCEECARGKVNIVCRASEISTTRGRRAAEDPYVCGACEAPVPCGLDFVPFQVGEATRITNGVKDVLDEVHLLLVNNEDPVEGIGADAADAERARRNPKKYTLEWFHDKAREDLGDEASEEDVSAQAEEDFAAHAEKKAEAKAKAQAKKRALERVGQLQEQLRDTQTKLARSERLFEAALALGAEKRLWDRAAVKQELEAEDALFPDDDCLSDEPAAEE
jgi:hypothetical protein